MIIKTAALYFIVVFVDVAFPRFRTEQAILFFIKIPALIGVGGILVALAGVN
jgi:NADH:ubiquinone oxidoreductase subunit H